MKKILILVLMLLGFSSVAQTKWATYNPTNGVMIRPTNFFYLPLSGGTLLGSLLVTKSNACEIAIRPGVTAYDRTNVAYISVFDRATTNYVDLMFDTGNPGTQPTLMLSQGGDVSIGTTNNYGAKFAVNGSQVLLGSLTISNSGNAQKIFLKNDSTNLFQLGNGSMVSGPQDDVLAYVYGTGNFRILTGGSDSLTIDSAGHTLLRQGARFYIKGATSGYTALRAPNNGNEQVLILPADAGTSGGVLQTDGSGNTSWGSGLTVTNDVIVAGSTTNRMVFYGGILISNILNFHN